MSKRIITGALLALALLGTAGHAAEPEVGGKSCDVPDAMAYTDKTLPRVAAKLKARESVRIVVLGTGSSAGQGTFTTPNGYPERLAVDLAKIFPQGRFEIVNLSKRGILASEMQKLFAAEVYKEKPSLVIWQTGTVDAVKGIDLGSFGQTIASGIQELQEHGADVILMDMQFSPHTSTALNVGPYRDYMRWLGQTQSVILFDRFAMMRYWEESGAVDFSSNSKEDQARNSDFVHGCIAALLAETVEAAVADQRAETPKQ